jgi:hypothetical protein
MHAIRLGHWILSPLWFGLGPERMVDYGRLGPPLMIPPPRSKPVPQPTRIWGVEAFPQRADSANGF